MEVEGSALATRIQDRFNESWLLVPAAKGPFRSQLVEGLLSRCPATWSEFLGLQSLKNAEDLVNVATHVEVVYGDPTNYACGVYDVGGTEADTGVLVQYAEVCREISLKVSQHREWELVKTFVVFAPSQVGVLGIGAASKNLTVELLEVLVLVAELDDFSWAHKREVEWPEEYRFPLPVKRRVGDGLELLAVLKRDARGEGVRWEFVADR